MMRFLFVLIALTFSTNAFAVEVKEVTSPGGIKAWMVEEHGLPLIAIKVVFKNSGSAWDPSGKEGRANLLAAMLTEGAGSLDSKAFNEALDERAMHFNTSIDEDLIRAGMESLSSYRDEAFSYLGMALVSPRFDSEALERTRRQTLATLEQAEQQPGYKLFRGWQKIAYGDHPYGKPTMGFKETVSGFDADDLQRAARRYLTRENMLVAVVGDITPEQLGALLDKHLGGLPAKFDPDSKVEEFKLPGGNGLEVIDFDIPQTMISFGANGLKRSDPDYFTAYVMNQILGGNGALNVRLGEEIREKRGLSYGVSSSLDPMSYAASWRGSFATRNEKAAESLQVLHDTLKGFVEGGPTDDEMRDAKQYLMGSFVLSLDTNSEIANFLISMQLNNLGIDYLDKRNGMVEAVKRDDVKAMAKRLIDPDKLLIVMVGKPVLGEQGKQ